LRENTSHPELPRTDYTIPSRYYDKYPLVFTFYEIDREIARIGENEQTKKRTNSKQQITAQN